MPLLTSTYRPPRWLPGGHCQTVWPFLVRRHSRPSEPVTVPLPDGDRLVADYYPPISPPGTSPAGHRLLIIAHGLEGNSQRPYVVGLAETALAQGFAVLAWNFRGCGREDNLLPRFYYAGCSEDLDALVHWCQDLPHEEIYLAGFSMGGNITLKWLGEQGAKAQARGVKAAAAVSVPCDLLGCSDVLARYRNSVYQRRFVRDLVHRLRAKAERFPGQFDLAPVSAIRSVRAFDDYYTAPLNGYDDAAEYYRECSANRFLSGIAVPTLILNARNDPFLSAGCFPQALSRDHASVYLEAPDQGGHVGFARSGGRWWADDRVCEFLLSAHEDDSSNAR